MLSRRQGNGLVSIRRSGQTVSLEHRHKNKPCPCDVCSKFGRDSSRWVTGECDVCKCVHKHLVDYIPPLLKEFLGYENLCWACRNGIRCYVVDWGLCWMTSPTEALKWAMVDWLRTNYWGWHMEHAIIGVSSHADAVKKRDEKEKSEPHERWQRGPGEGEHLCCDCWTYFKGHATSRRCPACKEKHQAHVARFNARVTSSL